MALLLPLVAVIIGVRLPLRDNSFLWHVRAGALQIKRGSVLTADPFSFTFKGTPWRTQSWLMDVLYGWFESVNPHVLGGWIVGLSAVLLLGAVAIRAYRSVNNPLVTAVVTLAAMWVSLGWFSPRPVVVSMCLFAVLIVATSEQHLSWSIPLIVWVWAAVHGGFVVGIGYLVLDALRLRNRRAVIATVASIVTATLTAHGWAVWSILVSFLKSAPALDSIVEWAVPDFFGLALLPFLGVIVALIVSARIGRLSETDQWLVMPFLVFAFSASRAVPLAVIALTPWIASGLKPYLSVPNSPGNYATMGIAVCILVVPILLPLDGGLDETSFPIAASQAISEDRIFHEDGTGGYLIYSQFPKRLVYIDDRAELYAEAFVEYGEVRSGRKAWQEHFQRWGIRQALLRSSAPLTRLLKEAEWEVLFEDDHFVVLNSPDKS